MVTILAYFVSKKRSWTITVFSTIYLFCIQASTHYNFYTDSTHIIEKLPEYPVYTFTVQLIIYYLFFNTNYLLTQIIIIPSLPIHTFVCYKFVLNDHVSVSNDRIKYVTFYTIILAILLAAGNF